MKIPTILSRRGVIAGATMLGLMMSSAAAMADTIKVAGIFTLPVEQQWISRIHIALNAAQERGDIEYVYSENVSNTDYERVMREYAESGVQLVVVEVFGLERAARKVAADYPETAFLMGSSFKPQEPNFSVFDNFIHEPAYLSGMVAGAASESNVIDTSGDYPGTILASAIWHMETTIDTAIAAVAGGSYTPDDYGKYSFMAHGGGSLTMDTALVSAQTAAAVMAREAAIKDGSYTVTINDTAPVSDK
jgi:basic membrane lipoprotein Med (substrate-binding protein (PBP1-ABC) superfamily)